MKKKLNTPNGHIIEVELTENGERVSKVTRPDGSTFVVVVPREGLVNNALEHWLRPWMTEGDEVPELMEDGLLNRGKEEAP